MKSKDNLDPFNLFKRFTGCRDLDEPYTYHSIYDKFKYDPKFVPNKGIFLMI